ncbi:MAG: hypothetical protein IPP38_10185 [Bacteroidetes bacterium]|nr:hypothetical protein [Bacteroidota bacterium]
MSDIVSTSFTITPGLNMSISGATQICEGDATPLTASGATTYSWSSTLAYTLRIPLRRYKCEPDSHDDILQ